MNKLQLHPKVTGASVSGSVALVILWVMGFWIDVPAEPAAALGVICAAIGGYLTPS